jgi:hypothetical protein
MKWASSTQRKPAADRTKPMAEAQHMAEARQFLPGVSRRR